ncbi:DNA-directed DNA polymerase protein [Dioscorea alata]|uniref:DNA-directed DNA polymerase protein n=1 Tax=Dioscorea alata TaxID=55571 RepID=A0ACB7W055_DIOAL|nr:DNA-directed DNA polymerase protein [Dioscorea alata]
MLTMTLEPARALCSVTRASRNTSLRFCIPPARLAVAAHRAPHGVGSSLRNLNKHLQGSSKPRVFLLDVNPLCYEGSKPSFSSFARWLSLFFSEVSLQDPVIAVLDGEEGNEYRRMLMPSYKAHRRKFLRAMNAGQSLNTSEAQVTDVLQKCHVPVIKVNGYEADDVVATLMDQVLQRGFRVVIGSPDKDFKQLISEDVQMVMPLQEFGRWSFYTLKHYIAQYNSDPSSDLSLRCLIGDEVDGVPGIQHVAPSFGRKTAQKLLKKHGSLPNLLAAAAIRTVGKQYVQEALNKHADYLRKNYDVLSLRRDAAVHLQEEWLLKRDRSNDSNVLSSQFIQRPSESHKFDVT